MPGLLAPPAAPPADRTLVLDRTLLEYVGHDAAWQLLSPQVALRWTCPPLVAPAVQPDGYDLSKLGADLPVLWHFVQDDPTLLGRVTWTPAEHRTASGMLDRAVARRREHLAPGRTPYTDIDFWTEGRHLVVGDRETATVPTAALPWLSTGDWAATEVEPLRPRDGGRIRTNDTGVQDWLDEHGYLHREDGPAQFDIFGGLRWYRHGQGHRDDGPAVILRDGGLRWCQHGEFHRKDGPASIDADGSQMWFADGEIHRDGGPAIVGANGYRAWYFFGRRHRKDGPAVINPDGSQEWWEYGERRDPPAAQ